MLDGCYVEPMRGIHIMRGELQLRGEVLNEASSVLDRDLRTRGEQGALGRLASGVRAYEWRARATSWSDTYLARFARKAVPRARRSVWPCSRR